MDFHQTLTKRFASHSDQAKAASMAAYMKGHFQFYGIPSTERKQLTREVIQEVGIPNSTTFEEEVRACWLDPHREVQYSAQELVARKKWYKHTHSLQLIEWMIVTRSWWDTVDFVAATLAGGYFEHHPDKIQETVRSWNDSDDLWLIRSSLLFQLKYGTKTDTQLLSDLIVPHIASSEFFIQKAIGWALRQVSKSDPQFVRSFLDNHTLRPVSLREAKKYI